MTTFGDLLSDSFVFDDTIYHIEGTDNATADAASMTAARTALLAAGGGTITFDGTLNLSSIGLFTVGSTTIPLGLVGTGPTATIRFSGDGVHYLHWGHLGYLFPNDNKYDGTVVPITTYGSLDAYKWRQFTSSSADQFSAGDWIYVWSENAADSLASKVEVQAAPANHHPGEFVQIKAVDGNMITLESYVQDFMTTLWIHKRDIAMGPFKVGHFSVIVDEVEVGTRSFEFRSCVGGLVEHIHFKGKTGGGAGCSGSAHMVFRNNTFEGSPEEFITSGGFTCGGATASTNVLFDNYTSSGDYRHHFDTSAFANIGNTTRIGTNRNLTIRNWNARVSTNIPVTVVYSGGAGTLPAVGDTITWNAAGSHGRVVQLVSGNASAGTMKIRQGTNNGFDSDDVLSGAATSWTANVDSVTGDSLAAILHTHEGGYGTVFQDCNVELQSSAGAGYCYQARARATEFIGCRVNGTHGVVMGFLIAANECKVIGCRIKDCWIGIETNGVGSRNGDGCIIQDNQFEQTRDHIVLNSNNNKVAFNQLQPPTALSATGTYFAPITVRASATGQHIINNYFERTPSPGPNPPVDQDSAIWQASTGLVTKCMGNIFSGWGDLATLEAPGDAYPFYTGAYGAIAQDDTFFTEWKDRNFFD